jgi:hypothetical protein
MAVNSETSRIQYAGNNSTVTAYTVPFPFLENGHLYAVETTSAGVEQSITLANHTGAGTSSGGTVTTTTAVPTSSTLTIYRQVDATQNTSYEEGGDFPAASHERALDKLTMLAQQNARAASARSLRVSEATGALDEIIGVANTMIGLDGDKQPKAMTVAEVKAFLALAGVTLSVPAGMKTAADAGERAIAVPEFTGQLLTQRDTKVIYVATGTSAGNWTAVSMTILLAGLSAGFFTADATGREKFADGIFTAAKLASTLDLTGKTVTLPASAIVGTTQLATGAVTTAKLADGAVTPVKAGAGFFVQAVHTSLSSVGTITGTIPYDTTIPQSGEGTAISGLDTTITPTSATSKILVRVVLSATCASGGGVTAIAALFRDSGANALAATQVSFPVGYSANIILEWLDSPATTSAVTYKVRGGKVTGGADWYVNATNAGAAVLGGAMKSTLTATEIKV